MLSDATYKLLYGGYPVLTCGTTDKENSFHPFGLMVTRHEREEDFKFLFDSIAQLHKTMFGTEYKPDTIIADNASAISNGFKATFNSSKRVNCWAHVIRKIDQRLKPLPDATRASIRADIFNIQLQTSSILFDKAIELFRSKWLKQNSSKINEFLEYFQQWCQPGSNGWFEGYDLQLPSTSNAIESIHRYMKTGLMSQRLGLLQFLNAVINPKIGIISWWSRERSAKIWMIH